MVVWRRKYAKYILGTEASVWNAWNVSQWCLKNAFDTLESLANDTGYTGGFVLHAQLRRTKAPQKAA